MTNLTKKVRRLSAGKVFEAGKFRQIVVTIEPPCLLKFRAKGCRRSYSLTTAASAGGYAGTVSYNHIYLPARKNLTDSGMRPFTAAVGGPSRFPATDRPIIIDDITLLRSSGATAPGLLSKIERKIRNDPTHKRDD